jgi:hypothetical protein
MVSVISLWLPIIVSAAIVFVASSIIHMFLPYHRKDLKRIPDEDAAMDVLGKIGIPPGDYVLPHAGSPKAMQSPEYIEKMTKGPVAFITVLPSGRPSMVKNLIQWFVYCVIVGIFAAYITGKALEPGAPYLSVFRFAGCTAFAGYALALMQNSIWFKRSWSATMKSSFDGLVYALLTAGTLGWLWPA